MMIRYFAFATLCSGVVATLEDLVTPVFDEADAAAGEALLQTAKQRREAPSKDVDMHAPNLAPLRDQSWADACYGSEGYQGAPECVPAEKEAAHRKYVDNSLLAMDSNQTMVGEDAPLTAEGFKDVTSVCCPVDTEAFFNRLLDSMDLAVCSKAHVQGLMHWFTCAPDMDFQYVLDVIENGNSGEFACKYWAPIGEECPELSAECEGKHCGAPLPTPENVTDDEPTLDEASPPTAAPNGSSSDGVAEAIRAPAEAPASATIPMPIASAPASAPVNMPMPLVPGEAAAPVQLTLPPTPPPTTLPPTTTTEEPTTTTITTTTTVTTTTTTVTTTTTTTTTVTTTTNVCQGDVEFKFWNSTVYHSNLNSLGPHRGQEGIRVSNLGDHKGIHFDLLVESTSDRYASKWARYNGVYGYYGYLTMNMGSAMDLKFTIVKAGTREPLVLPKFYFSFFDMDTANPDVSDYPKKGAEVVTASGFFTYHVGPDTELDIFENDEGKTVFRAQVFGTSADNPNDPNNMTPLQQNRAVAFEFLDTSSWEASYQVLDGGLSAGREVYFAGRSQLAMLPCGDP